jgi:hypothetical protein
MKRACTPTKMSEMALLRCIHSGSVLVGAGVAATPVEAVLQVLERDCAPQAPSKSGKTTESVFAYLIIELLFRAPWEVGPAASSARQRTVRCTRHVSGAQSGTTQSGNCSRPFAGDAAGAFA